MAFDFSKFSNNVTKPNQAQPIKEQPANEPQSNQAISNSQISQESNNITISTNPSPNQPISNMANVANQTPTSTTEHEADRTITGNGLDQLILSNLDELNNGLRMKYGADMLRNCMALIHKALAKDPVQVTILSEAQSASIFQGYATLSGIDLVQKTESKAKKLNKNVDLE